MAIGLAQINPVIGNFEYNAKIIAKYIKKATDMNLDIIIFPEFALTGFPLGNIIERHPILAEENLKWLKGLAKITKGTAAVVGFIEPSKAKQGYNSSIAILKNGKIEQIVNDNYSEPIEIKGQKYKIFIDDGIFDCDIKELNSDIIVNCSANSVTFANDINLLQDKAREYKKTIIYVNQAGGNDNFVSEGTSRVINNNGQIIAQAKSFDEDFVSVDLNKENNIIKLTTSAVAKKEFSLDYEDELERTYNIIVQGIKDYFAKCGIKRAVLGLSGGLDSTVCAVLLADALGKENVFGISMPSKLTSDESKSDAKELANNLGIHFAEATIKPIVDTTTDCFSRLFENIEKDWNDRYTKSFTPDNIQARARATYLWGVSNEFPSCIPIATSDKSEAYMGYATINGDMSGGFAPIADVTKTKLFALARWLNKNRPQKNAIPESIILKKPGAELAIDPNTGKTLNAEDALMPYEFLDEIIWRIENKQESYNDLVNATFIYEKKNNISKEQKLEWLDKFYRRMSSALYKWAIMPPAVITGEHSINKAVYSQAITSGKINYKGSDESYIDRVLAD